MLGRLRNFRRVDCLKKEILLVLINFIHQGSDNLAKVKETFEKLDEDHTGFVDVMKMQELLPELFKEWQEVANSTGTKLNYTDFVTRAIDIKSEISRESIY